MRHILTLDLSGPRAQVPTTGSRRPGTAGLIFAAVAVLAVVVLKVRCEVNRVVALALGQPTLPQHRTTEGNHDAHTHRPADRRPGP